MLHHGRTLKVFIGKNEMTQFLFVLVLYNKHTKSVRVSSAHHNRQNSFSTISPKENYKCSGIQWFPIVTMVFVVD
uniref:Ovule protein n=1 Tax=Panagrolaimus sp. JU765 TaxID=591449 RepID=A0AC34RDF1_9BILA